MNTIYYETQDYGDDFLMHHGIKGQKWGIRRYQNEDGSLTAAGKERYVTGDVHKRFRNSMGPYLKSLNVGNPNHTHARAATRILNKADQYVAENNYQSEVAYKKAKLADKKMKKAESKGKEEKAERYKNRSEDYTAMGKIFHERARAGANMVDNMLGMYSQNGYSVSSRRYMRSVDRGKNLLKSMPGHKHKVKVNQG